MNYNGAMNFKWENAPLIFWLMHFWGLKRGGTSTC